MSGSVNIKANLWNRFNFLRSSLFRFASLSPEVFSFYKSLYKLVAKQNGWKGEMEEAWI